MFDVYVFLSARRKRGTTLILDVEVAEEQSEHRFVLWNALVNFNLVLLRGCCCCGAHAC